MTTMKLNNSNDIVANSVQLVVGNSLINVADYLGNSPTYEDLALKADKTAVYNISAMNTLLATKASTGASYSIAQSDANLALKADVLTTYNKQDVNMFLAEKASQNQVSDISALLSSSINTFDTYKADKSTTYTKTQVDSLLTSNVGYTTAQVDTFLASKANTGVSYTLAQSDANLLLKADKTTSYLKTEIDAALATKAAQSTSYLKTEVDTALALRALQSTSYLKTEVDTLLSGKANNSQAYTKAACDTLLAAKQATLSNTVAIAVSTLSCTSLTTSSLLTAISCSGDASIAGALAITGNVSSARFTSGSRARFYNQLTGAVHSGVLSHENTLQFAISATVPPLTSEVYMTMDTSGITISKTLNSIDTTITGALSVSGISTLTGNVNTTGRFTSNGTARFYYNNYGAYNASIISHPTNINLALSNTVPPLSTELAITMDTTIGIVLNKYTEAKAGFYVSGGDVSVSNNIYAYGDHYCTAAKTFYSTNFANPSLWDKRMLLGHTTNDAIRFYAGPTGIAFYQHADNGSAPILILQSTDKKAVFYGNITTQTGGSVSASSFPTLSDARVKTNFVTADLNECERLVKTISPKGYERTDYNSGRKFGYVAQDWLQEISNDFNCVVSDYDEYDSEGNTQQTLHAIDTLPIIATIHGALKVALSKIEQLEQRVAMLEHVF